MAKKDICRPSAKHSSRRAHNWLIYDAYDKSLTQHANKISGVVYDLGAGKSPYADWILHFAYRYISVDWSESLHSPNPHITADLNRPLPIDNNVADVVVSLSVLEHLHSPAQMLAEAFRILKPGGRLLLQTPWQWWIHEAPHDYYRYTPFGLTHLTESRGFVDVQIQAQAGFFSMMVLKSNYFSLRFIRGPGWLRSLIRVPLWLAWQAGQLLAPVFDRLDREWALEAPGYFLVAVKPEDDGPSGQATIGGR